MGEGQTERNGGNNFTLRMPGGSQVTVTGHSVVLVVIFLAGLIVLGFINGRDHTAMVKELKVMSWLLSQSPENRPELMPPPEVAERLAPGEMWKFRAGQERTKNGK
jgi:hypothetical protein